MMSSVFRPPERSFQIPRTVRSRSFISSSVRGGNNVSPISKARARSSLASASIERWCRAACTRSFCFTPSSRLRIVSVLLILHMLALPAMTSRGEPGLPLFARSNRPDEAPSGDGGQQIGLAPPYAVAKQGKPLGGPDAPSPAPPARFRGCHAARSRRQGGLNEYP